jgi:zinc finger CCHC domain-containing protein 8
MAEEPSRDSGGQFQETVVTEGLLFSDKHGNLNSYPSLSSPPIYDRYTVDVLGTEIEDELSFDEDVSHCFNCGSTQHLVSSCPTPHNVELIALSRQMYNFFKPSRSVEQMTISAAAEFKRQRHEWIDSFEPGHVRGPLLREALGLHDDDVGSDVPWLKNMADWGYPSGWFGKADPREGIIQKIDHLFVEDLDLGEGNHSLVIFGDKEAEILDISALPAHKLSSREGIDKPQDTRESPVIRVDTSKQVELERCRRWAAYPSTYFSSDLLPVYNGTRLPPMLPTTSSTFTSERRLLWERLLNDAASSRIPGSSLRILNIVPSTTAPLPPPPPPPPPVTPPPPLPPLPPPIPAINKKVDDAPPGAHNPSNTSSDGESDMELSDSDT